MDSVQLNRVWQLGPQIGSGGFGRVFEATSEGVDACAAKFVPKDVGAKRELLFEELCGVRNVVPIVDSGEAGDDWVLVMPRAEYSLRDRLEKNEFSVDDALVVMKDVARCLGGPRRSGRSPRHKTRKHTLVEQTLVPR